MTFPDKTPDEVKLVTFDFSSEAAANTVLSNIILDVEVASGEGALPEDIGFDTPAFADAVDDDGAPIAGHAGHWVQVLVGEGIDAAKYRLICEVDASNGEHHRIDKILPVKEKAALVE